MCFDIQGYDKLSYHIALSSGSVLIKEQSIT